MAEASAEQGRATRQRLLTAAVALIGEVGWNGVTTRMVADRAGVGSGVVHYHFSSVNDLLVTASVGFARELLTEMSTQLRAQPNLDQGLNWLLAQLADYPGDDPASLLIVEMFLASTRLPELRAHLRDMVVEFRCGLAAWLRERGYNGEAEAAATVLAAALDGLLLHHSLDSSLDLATLAVPLRAMLRKDDDPEG